MAKISDVTDSDVEAPTGRVLAFDAPHPFAEFLRIIGRGSTVGRPLDQTEAEAAFDMILKGEVEPMQLGAFLLVLRYRTEAPSELAGFVRSARKHVASRDTLADLDWPSYADRHKQLPLFSVGGEAVGGERHPHSPAWNQGRRTSDHPCCDERTELADCFQP